MAASQLSMLVRSFSTSGAAAQMARIPIQVFGLEGRYAIALYSAATKMKQVETVEKELVEFQTSINTDPKLRDFIDNPSYNRSEKSQVLKIFSERLKMTAATSNFLQLLADNGRLKILEGVISSFKIIMAAHREEVTCEVTTAKELDPAQRKRLEDTLRKFVKGKESIRLNYKIDPAILGGMIVNIGDKYVDMSVASKIKKYTELISTAV